VHEREDELYYVLDAIRIVENCRRAMKSDARLLVIEAFFAEPGELLPANMVDTQVPLLICT
jgi:hypothetical protein